MPSSIREEVRRVVPLVEAVLHDHLAGMDTNSLEDGYVKLAVATHLMAEALTEIATRSSEPIPEETVKTAVKMGMARALENTLFTAQGMETRARIGLSLRDFAKTTRHAMNRVVAEIVRH